MAVCDVGTEMDAAAHLSKVVRGGCAECHWSAWSSNDQTYYSDHIAILHNTVEVLSSHAFGFSHLHILIQ